MAVVTHIAVMLTLSTLFAVCVLTSLPPAARTKFWAGARSIWTPSRRVSASPASTTPTADLTAEKILLSQLENANPATLGPLHVALAQVYEADGRHVQALEHFEKAANLVVRAGDADRVVDALVALGEAYLRVGRTADAERELMEATRLIETSRAVGPHQGFAVDHALGHARRDLGQLDSALGLYTRAMNRRGQHAPEDMASLLSDIAEIHQYRGHNAEALQYLRQAQLQLQMREGLVSTMDAVPAVARAQLDPEIHRRIAVANYGLGNYLEAADHFKIALRLEKQLVHPRAPVLALILAGFAKVQPNIDGPHNGQAPASDRHTAAKNWWRGVDIESDVQIIAQPSRQEGKRDVVGPKRDQKSRNGGALRGVDKFDDAKALRDSGKLEEAESLALSVTERRIPAAGGIQGANVAAAMNLLGSIRMQRERYSEASDAYLMALTAALASPRDGGGVGGSEAKDAYMGISYIMPMLHLLGQPSEAKGLFDKAIIIADDAGVPKSNTERLGYESRLRANAIDPVYRMSAPVIPPEAPSKVVHRPATDGSPTKLGSDAQRWWRGEGGSSDVQTPAASPLPNSATDRWYGQKIREAAAPTVASAQQAGILRGRANREDAESLRKNGRLEEAESVAQQAADMRIREAGGIKGTDVAKAMNLLGSIRRERQRFHEASKAYVSALTAALATPRDGGGIGGAQAETAYLGLSYIMPMFIAFGKPDEAKALLVLAVAVADAAGVPKNASERESFEQRLRANAIDPVYRISDKQSSTLPSSTHEIPDMGATTLTNAVDDSQMGDSSMQLRDMGGAKAEAVSESEDSSIDNDDRAAAAEVREMLATWFRDPKSEVGMAESSQAHGHAAINIGRIEDDQLFDSF